jgi:GWxTD domain-containing protein
MLYERAGLIAVPGPVSYVGTLGFFASPHPDSTLSLLTLSLTARTLTFIREGDRYRAGYTVTADIRRSGSIAHHFEAKETVRVKSFKETTRGEESVIFQEYFRLTPGQYTLTLAVRDDAGAKVGTYEAGITVPTINTSGLSSSVPVHEASPRTSIDSVPHLVTSPRSTAVFGRDSTFMTYVEAYGLEPDQPIRATVRANNGSVLWSDSVLLSRVGNLSSGLVHVPVGKVGIGAVHLVLTRSGFADSTRIPLFVSFGDELPVASFEDMLSYLRFFAGPQRIKALRDTAEHLRGDAWAAFLRETDPVPTTPQHEALQAYFTRIQQANSEFREEGGAGWLSDRGMVFVGLGPPDNVFEPGMNRMNQRGQAQVWEYQRQQLQLVFVDQNGFGRWRLTNQSELEFQNALRRQQGR